MLGLPFGAALAGSATLLEGAEHDRRRMGGTLPQLWPLAVMVLAHLDERLGSWPQVFAHFDAFRALLARQGRFTLSPIGTEATNTVWLDVGPLDPARLRACARQQGLVLPEPQGNRFAIRANVGWLPHAPQDLLARLELCANLTTRGSVLASRPDNLSQCPARSPQPRQPPSDKTLGDVAA